MKAIVCERYGSPDVLQLKEIEKPVPKGNEILVKVHAASVNAADLETLRGDFIVRMVAPRKPRNRVLGSDLAGRVEEVGADVTRYKPGDDVWGDLSFPHHLGAFAEYVCASENGFALKPASMSFEEAAAYPQAAIIPLQSLRDKGQVKPGQKVLINGAGGGMGTFAVQIAKYYGAEVTGVDNHEKLERLRSIGADHVIDYARENYTKRGQRYDLVLDVAAHHSVFDYRNILNPDGIFMMVGGSLSTLIQVVLIGWLLSKNDSKKIGLNTWEPNNKDDLNQLAELYDSGEVIPVIDKRYPLSGVPDALHYLASGKPFGKLVISI